jgi:dihydroorotase-like cyclic amidohydrolase
MALFEWSCKMNYIKPEDIKEYVSKNPTGIAGMSEELSAMVNHFAELMIVEFTETVKQTATRIAQTGFNDGLSAEEVNKRVNSALYVLEVMRERFKD